MGRDGDVICGKCPRCGVNLLYDPYAKFTYHDTPYCDCDADVPKGEYSNCGTYRCPYINKRSSRSEELDGPSIKMFRGLHE